MIDYEKVIHGLIDPLIEHPETVMIKEVEGRSSRDITLIIIAENDDTARLIGRKGSVANALREAVSIASKADDSNIHIHLKFQSVDEEENAE